jgi:hypothetical protein
MVEENNELEIIKKFKKDLKPNLFLPIWNTIICSGPPLNLIFRYFLENDIKNPTVDIILTVIAMIWTIINWYCYVKERINFTKNWKEIPVELETLNYEEKPSKDYVDIISNALQITAIASLVAFFIFFAITIVSKLSYFKYFMLFSILVFILSGIGLIIVSIIHLFSFFKEVKKEGRLKNVLIRFFLIFTLLFIIQMILIFIMHKSLDWFSSLFNPLMATLPIFLSTEVVNLYKKVKKEYLGNTSPDESDCKSTNRLEV